MEDINYKSIPQKDAENAVEQYYKAKYHKCLRPQKKVPKTNSYRRFRSQLNKKELGIKDKRKTKSKRRTSSRRSSNKKRKYCRIKKTRYTKDRKHYRKFSKTK